MNLGKAGSVTLRVPLLLLVITVFLAISCTEAERIVDEAKARLTPSPTVSAEKTVPGTPVAAPAFTPAPTNGGPLSGLGTPVAAPAFTPALEHLRVVSAT